MRATIKTNIDPQSFICDNLILPIYQDIKLSALCRGVDKACAKHIARVIESDDFNAKNGEVLSISVPSGVNAKRIVLWGLGDKEQLNRQSWSAACTSLGTRLALLSGGHHAFIADIKTNKTVPQNWALQQLATTLTRHSYRYTTTKSKPSSADKAKPKKLTLIAKETNRSLQKSLNHGVAIGSGINIARELGNLPGNVCTPKYLSAESRKLGRKYASITTKVMGEKQMLELGMGSLLSVGNGSEQESQFIIIDYRGGKKSEQPHVLVGKGITFDTGGISLKPGSKMDEMKFDMCGAASVVGTMSAVAEMQLPTNIIGVIASAENMPAGNATKPGDVVTSMAGKTIEVLNTDAEGRLVLCDALHYAKRFKPQTIIDIATLTGACIVALGHHATGLLSNDDDLAASLLKAGRDSADRAWQLPLWDDYQKQLQTPFADLANIGGPSAGTITAGCFLSQFAEGMTWAHLDIAGTAWNQGGGKGASGRPVAMLCQYLKSLSD